MSPYQTGEHHEPSVYDLPPPSPPPEMPPLPKRAPYPFHGGDSWRPSNNHGSSQNHEFSFRNKHDAPQYLQENGRTRDYITQDRSHQRSENRNRYRQGDSYRNSAQRGVNNGTQRWNRRVATAARPLLSHKQGDSPVQMLGNANGSDVGMRFLPADDMSDSNEEQMDVSESDEDQLDIRNGSLIRTAVGLETADDAAADIEPPAKKRALGTTRNESADEASLPRWSNPDPYTSLPPIDESLRKKKDVVKIIRKARIATAKPSNVINQAAANDDFISFGFEEEPSLEVESIRSSSPVEKNADRRAGAPNAPSGPKQFSHLQALHSEPSQRAPGTQDFTMSADKMGPPPGLEHGVGAMHSNPALDHDAPLGNRKRTHDDIIKSTLERPAVRKKGFLGTSNGSLVEEWTPRGDTDPTPWHDPNRAYHTENMGFRLHKEICDFYEFVKPQHFEQRVREDLLDRLQKLVEEKIYDCRVYCFGSFAAGLYLPNADMDVVIISEEFRTLGSKVVCQSNSSMRKFGSYLQTSRFAEEDSVEVIVGAKVPLIKFVDRATAIRVDVSFENQTGLVANDTFNAWKSQFPAMPIIVTLIKQYLMMRGLNEVVNGGLGGLSVTCLVTSLLQNMPRVQSGELIPEQHLGEILIEFLDFYGNQLDTARTGIKMDPPGYFDKYDYARMSNKSVYQPVRTDRLAILDPNLPDNDISGGSRNVMVILDRFSQAHLDIIRAMRAPTQRSLLDLILGGNYNTFSWHRNHLRRLYQVKWGNPEIDLRNHNRAELRNNSNTNGKPQPSSQIASSSLRQDSHATNFFINPINPGVQIPPQVSRKNAKKLKFMQGKENFKLQNDKLSKIAKLKQQSVPKFKTKLSSKEKGRNRAVRLMEEYPLMEGIPYKISASIRTTLIAKYNARQVELDRTTKHEATEGSSSVANKKNGRVSPKISNARLAEMDRNLGGTSTADPITID